MVVDDLSEKEQLDMMRSWWAENGRYVVGGVVVGIAILFGWNQWRSGVAEAQIEASAMYEELMSGVGDGDAEAAAAAAAALFDQHPDTAYTSQGRLAMARLYMEKGRDQDAVNVLQDLIDADATSEVALVGRLRLARVLLYQDKADAVVALLKDHRDHAFSPRYNELLGDAYFALGSFTEAEAAYNLALGSSRGSRTIDTNLIQLKINDLPAANELVSASEDDAEDESQDDAGEADAAAPAAEPAAAPAEAQDELSGAQAQQ